jgi:lipopolysaccharide/colanic/teichoic acid biosynthesis glycosyltransferase
MGMVDNSAGLAGFQAFQKRVFDIIISALGLLLSWWLIVAAFIAASLDTRSNGLFMQHRVGRNGKLFTVVKIKTMRSSRDVTTTVTRTGDPRVTGLGRFFRKTKIDELPQLWNVLIGDMSFVGPRPDVPGYADRLQGEERLVLSVRPGITGPATLKYRDEEDILAAQEDPERYNREVIYPDKVRINLEYIQRWSMMRDLKYIWWTIAG